METTWEKLRHFKPTETGVVGRPTLCSEEVATEILKNLAAGSYLMTACEAAGVSYDSVRRWLLQAKQDQAAGKDSIYRKFAEQLTRAENMAEQALVTRLNVAEDWRAQAFLLERRHRDRWGKQEQQQTAQQVLIISDELAAGMLEALKIAADRRPELATSSANPAEILLPASDYQSESEPESEQG